MGQVLDYGPRESVWRRRSFRRRVLLIALVLLVAGWFGVSLRVESGEYSSYICTDCGLGQTQHTRQLAVIGIPFHRSHTTWPTPVSGVAARHNLMAGHTHHWRFVHGGSQGTVGMYRASGDNNLLTMVHDGVVVDFINNLAALDRAAAERWLKGILENRRRLELMDTLLLLEGDYAIDVWNRPANFPTWWARNRQRLEQRLTDLQREDS